MLCTSRSRVLCPPRPLCTDARPVPPLVDIRVPLAGRPDRVPVVQHGTDATPEVRVDELACALPLEVAVVQVVVLVQHMQVLGQLLGRRELVHVDVGLIGRHRSIVLRWRTHHNGQHIPVQRVDKELLRDVVPAVGVLERQVELVVRVQDLETLARLGARAMERATVAVDVDLQEKVILVYQSVISRLNSKEERRSHENID